jgi:FkbM family methyltransferase
LPCTADSLVTLAWRYGWITVPPHDTVIGRSLEVYGEWAQNEIDLLRSLTPEDGVVIDVGAFLGTHTIALAERVGARGRVLAFEPQPQIFELLLRNLTQNQVRNVEAKNCAAASKRQILSFPRLDLCARENFANTTIVKKAAAPLAALLVPAVMLDEIEVARLDLIKIDAEGMEPQILEGAEAIVALHRPILYMECRSVTTGLELLNWLRGRSYRVFLHRPSAFNPQNFRNNLERIFGLARETNLLAVAEDAVRRYESQLFRDSDDILPIDDLDEFARRLLETPRWGEPQWEALSRVELIARMTHLLEDEESLRRELEDEHRRNSAVEERRGADIQGLERQRRFKAPLEERIAALEKENGALRFASQQEAKRRLQETATAIELRKRLAAQQIEMDQVRFETKWKARIAQAEERGLRRDLTLLAGGLRAAAVPAAAGGAACHAEILAAGFRESVLKVVRQLFDEGFYRQSNPDVELGPDGAFEHFLRFGGCLGRDPHPLFDSSFYLERNADVRAAGINPLIHFVLHGAKEARNPHPLFDINYYLSQLSTDTADQGDFNPLLHFVCEGARRGLNPHPLFLTDFYLEQVPEIREGGTDPLSHYVAEGAWRGYDPHPLFDSSYSLARYPQPRLAAVDPLSRFILYGAAAGEDPHPFFSSAQYRERVRTQANTLIHFAHEGSRAGLAPRLTFNLTRDQSILCEYDRIRHDGLPVLLFVSHMGGGGTEKHVRELAAVLRGRCHVFLLRPANHHLLGPATAGQVALSPLGHECPGLLFDAKEQFDDLVTVLRGLGVERVHIHQLEGNQGYLRKLITALGLPFDFSVHDYRVLSPRFSQCNHPRAFPGDDSEDMSPLSDSNATGAIVEWRRRHGWLVTEAERVLVPSVDSAQRIARAFPTAHCLAVAHPEPQPFDPLRVAPIRIRIDEPLRVVLIGEFLPHKGEDVVRSVCLRISERGEPIELHLLGFLSSGVAIDGLRDHGRYRDRNLPMLIDGLSAHVAWFPAQWPETYSYTLSAALRSGLPVIVSDLGALPERVAGRPWSWIQPWSSTPDAWCEALLEVRTSLLERRAPAPPAARKLALKTFYPDGYLEGLRTQ